MSGQDILIKLVSPRLDDSGCAEQESRLTLTDAVLFETPFVFMNGHNDFCAVRQGAGKPADLSLAWRLCARVGLLHEPGVFLRPWRREFSRVFSGAKKKKVKPIPYDHLIYRFVFTKSRSFARSAAGEGGSHRGVCFYHDQLVATLVEEGLCWRVSRWESNCNKGAGTQSLRMGKKKVALNIAVYALTH